MNNLRIKTHTHASQAIAEQSADVLRTTRSNTAAQLWAGVAKADITNTEARPCNDPLYVKALVLRCRDTTAIIITVDAVAIAEIGTIPNDYLANVRSRLHEQLGIEPPNVLINASHCHGVVCADIEERTVQAAKEAWQNMVPATAGVGSGRESRIMENRRLRLASGEEADVRRAYSLPPDESVVGVGPVDPQIGVLRLDRLDGRTLAVVYNFACHPIQGVPGGGNTADISGFASKIIEDNLGRGTIALFLQGCAGDVNPILYKDVDHPRNAEQLGAMLGLSTLQAVRDIRQGQPGSLMVINEALQLPRADLARRIESMSDRQARLLNSLKATNLNLRTYVSLVLKHSLWPDFPSYYSHRYIHEQSVGTTEFRDLDAGNRRDITEYAANIYIMEELTRIGVNINLLKKHQARNKGAGSSTVEVEVVGLRVGEFIVVTFPGELSVQIGLNIKRRSPHGATFVAGYTNGYIYYAPTAEQLNNPGGAQEDCDCILSEEWQELYERKVAQMLERLKPRYS